MEDKQKPSVADLKKSIIQYASKPPCDFDKHKALEFIGNLKDSAANCKDKKADYYASVHSKLLERISKPIDQFRSYIFALLGDRDYDKIVESLAKVDKACQEMSAPPHTHMGSPDYGYNLPPSPPSFPSPRYSAYSSSPRASFQRFHPYSFSPRYSSGYPHNTFGAGGGGGGADINGQVVPIVGVTTIDFNSASEEEMISNKKI